MALVGYIANLFLVKPFALNMIELIELSKINLNKDKDSLMILDFPGVYLFTCSIILICYFVYCFIGVKYLKLSSEKYRCPKKFPENL